MDAYNDIEHQQSMREFKIRNDIVSEQISKSIRDDWNKIRDSPDCEKSEYQLKWEHGAKLFAGSHERYMEQYAEWRCKDVRCETMFQQSYKKSH